MVESADTPSGPTLLALPVELRLLIYNYLAAPALIHAEVDYDCRRRQFYRSICAKDLPATKLIYFTLHALSATCSILHLEMRDAIVAVRAVLAKQKHFLQNNMVMMEFQWMKSSGITWVELERKNGIAAGPDFTDGWEDLDMDGNDAPDHYPEGIYQLAIRKRWNKLAREEERSNQ